MKKLIEQIMKFGIVGVIAFAIDYLVGIVVLQIALFFLGDARFTLCSQIASATGFTISVIANYILSFKFVFERKEDLNRKAEAAIFLVLSLIGLGLNNLIIWICTGPIYENVAFLQKLSNYSVIYTAAKVFATAIVMVYNFVSRKIFLEKKDK